MSRPDNFRTLWENVIVWFRKLKAESADLPIPDVAARAEAKQKPNGYVYAIDGVNEPNGAVPPERIRGCWKVGGKGES
jgi:hypothetical protein